MKLLFISALVCFSTFTFAQSSTSDTLKKAPENWFNLDSKDNLVRGISTEKAYQDVLKNKKSKPVIVAVIDSGTDIFHEDLEGSIWTNEKEIAGNGIDDDHNGYVDDVHGWNFIGGKDGKNVQYDNLEITRQYSELKKRFEGKAASQIAKQDKKDFETYQKVKTEYNKKLEEAKKEADDYDGFYKSYQRAVKTIKKKLGKDNFTKEDLDNMEVKTFEANLLLYTYEKNLDSTTLGEYHKYYENRLKYNFNEELDSRKIVGDNINDLTERFYGNNDMKGPDALHGTHVAGIIAANRTNTIGMKGIADNVKIMAVRAVPDGDERDKDIANAVRYAVDNGAKIINMSFGKTYSPQKKMVDEAFQYAESKGVLVVHAAGNDAENIDVVTHYPCKECLDGKTISTWIEVGASSWGNNEKFVADFSNYGKKNVDIFAPGVDIYSTVPDNKYKIESGTSMACPVVSGVAALLMSYYPSLTAKEVKNIILKSSTNYSSEKITKPKKREDDKKETIKFGKLSSTGSIINVYEAVKMAEKMTKGK